jgi:D-amino-acid oxidase
LIGVQDTDVHPIRGQTILVKAPGVNEFLSSRLGPGALILTRYLYNEPYPATDTVPAGHATYMIPRPSPEGHVLMGGTFQPNNWDLSVDIDTAKGIWERCVKMAPVLKDEKTRIISHNVGLRPARRGGPRIEAEWFKLPIKTSLLTQAKQNERDLLVVHAYGFGYVLQLITRWLMLRLDIVCSATGYQGSWGAAEEVVDILQRSLRPDT